MILDLFKGWKEYINNKEGIAIVNNKIQGKTVQIISKWVLCVILGILLGRKSFFFFKKKIYSY